MNAPAELLARFGDQLQRDVPLARYTAARIGGPADYLVVARNRDDLRDSVTLAWEAGRPLLVLGGGANVLIDDQGFRGLVVINRAQNVHHDISETHAEVRAESGVSLSTLARDCVKRGLSGLTWAVTVPGTVGGAVINNAGAHGSDMAGVVQTVETLARGGEVITWPVEAMAYAYRESRLKRNHAYVVLGAMLKLGREAPEVLRTRARDFAAQRNAAQPPGASMGSIFKNPPGDHAGRLIDAAGLKGTRIGQVMVSPVHANFFINAGGATAADYRALIEKTRATVQEQFGVTLELEVEIIGP